MKEWLKNKMKNSIKFIIPDKFLVDIKFKEKLKLFDICDISKLIRINFDDIFDFPEMSDEDLINYYHDFSKLNRSEKLSEVSEADFELYDIEHSCSYNNDKLHLNCKLFYKSPDELYGGTGKFSIDLRAVIKVPDNVSEALRVSEYGLLLNISDKTIDFSHHKIADVFGSCSLIDFNDDRCNDGLPDNIYIVPKPKSVPNIVPNHLTSGKNVDLKKCFSLLGLRDDLI